MSDIWLISDTHFGHSNILTFEPYYRPFKTIEDHDEQLIQNWNNVVKPGDKVFHLGDFCLASQSIKIAKRLNGNKYLIMGNHDKAPTQQYLSSGFHKLLGSVTLEKFILTHIPVSDKQFSRFKGNIHGHLHSKLLEDKRYFNVSVEQINLTPINYEEVKILFNERNS